jgi:hypothetical protein
VKKLFVACLVAEILVLCWIAGRLYLELAPGREDHPDAERTEYDPPPNDSAEDFVDDRLEDRERPRFDPALKDSRPIGPRGEWLLNSSGAVIQLDVPLIKPDRESALLTLHPSYAAAIASFDPGCPLLPSINMLDGKAKQFDDGLYAALDQAYYTGLQKKLHSHVQLVQRLFEKVGKESPAAPYLAAGLELAGVHVDVMDSAKRDGFLADFRGDETASKPIGFYTWNDTLSACFRVLRFFQREFGPEALAVPGALADALSRDPALLAEYRKAVDFYARLTNPFICLSVADLVSVGPAETEHVIQLAKEKGVQHATVALFPPSTSRETVLFERLFPDGLPGNVNLMRELIRRLRSGEVDLKPRPNSGWYDYQVHALETLLLPEKGEEANKLLLTARYKKRMLEAFQALVTKHRETHARQLKLAAAGAPPPPPEELSPRLRLEPCPTYCLRTARAYAFLANFLESALGKDTLRTLHGLRQGGVRERDLYDELHFMRDLFYGLYLLSLEDIGARPHLLRDEPVDQKRCYSLADNWVWNTRTDPDLSVDTRVSIPIYVDPDRGVVRLWVTLGVRLARLETSYAAPPHLKPSTGGDWRLPNGLKLVPARYAIAVDEFAEVECNGLCVLTREELRAVCDREKTKEAIVRALQNGGGD